MPVYDLFSAEFKRDPFPAFAQMRLADPIYANRSPIGLTTWYITRYEDVLAVLKDNEHFVKDVRNSLPEVPPSPPHQQPNIHQLLNQNMLFSDPPDHTRLRALVNQAFTPRRVEQMNGRVQQIADELLDKMADKSQMDVIADYALPLPVIVICEMLGIPPADQVEVADWSQAIIAPGGKRLNRKLRKQKMRALATYLQQMFADRRQRPQDDLVTALVHVKMGDGRPSGGDKLSEVELSSMVALLLVTGHETTVNLIGNGVLALLRHPEQLQLLLTNEVLWDTAVEELLRYDGPVETSTTRWVRDDYDFRGHLMRQGDVVRVSLASANRDTAQFDQPDECDVTRSDNKHLAFGHGSHYCLGAPLARLEGRVAVSTLFYRFPTLQLACAPEDLVWRSGVLFRGLESLPVVQTRP